MSPSISSVIMGCMPSRPRNNKHKDHENNAEASYQRSKRKDSDNLRAGADGKASPFLQPTISMMSDHTFKILKEIGELKSFSANEPSESKQGIDKHLDILMALENPQAALSGGTAKAGVSASLGNNI